MVCGTLGQPRNPRKSRRKKKKTRQSAAAAKSKWGNTLSEYSVHHESGALCLHSQRRFWQRARGTELLTMDVHVHQIPEIAQRRDVVGRNYEQLLIQIAGSGVVVADSHLEVRIVVECADVR